MAAKALCLLVIASQSCMDAVRIIQGNATAVAPDATIPKTLLSSASSKQIPSTFQEFYQGHIQGRGIWKWSNALDAYQRHFANMRGLSCNLAEVGVQSGGSIDMWHSVLGAQSHVYGLDINPQALQFGNAMTTITIGDQADVNMWSTFFGATVKSPLDVLIDDGGHEPHQMLVTLEQTLPRMNAGGFVAIEDIHGQHYIQSFFTPAANYIATQVQANLVDSVHVYPYLLMVQRAGQAPNIPKSDLVFAGSSATVDSFDALWAAIPMHAGGHVILENAGWGPFLTGQGLTNFFAVFAALHDYQVHDVPPGCATTSAATCTNVITSSTMQASVSGVHVYATRLIVEVAAAPLHIQAMRRGSDWLEYR